MTAGTHGLHAVLALAAVAVWGQLLQVQAATMLQRLRDAVRLSARLAHLGIFQPWQLIQEGSTSIVFIPLGEVSQSQPHGLEEVLQLWLLLQLRFHLCRAGCRFWLHGPVVKWGAPTGEVWPAGLQRLLCLQHVTAFRLPTA